MPRLQGLLALLVTVLTRSCQGDFLNSLLDSLPGLEGARETEYSGSQRQFLQELVHRAQNYSILSPEDIVMVKHMGQDHPAGHQKQSGDSLGLTERSDNDIQDVYDKKKNIRIRIDPNGNRRVPNLFKTRNPPKKLSTRQRFLKMRNRQNMSSEAVHSQSLAQPTTQGPTTKRTTTTTPPPVYLDSSDFRDDKEDTKREALQAQRENDENRFNSFPVKTRDDNFPVRPLAFRSQAPDRKDFRSVIKFSTPSTSHFESMVRTTVRMIPRKTTLFTTKSTTRAPPTTTRVTTTTTQSTTTRRTTIQTTTKKTTRQTTTQTTTRITTTRQTTTQTTTRITTKRVTTVSTTETTTWRTISLLTTKRVKASKASKGTTRRPTTGRGTLRSRQVPSPRPGVIVTSVRPGEIMSHPQKVEAVRRPKAGDIVRRPKALSNSILGRKSTVKPRRPNTRHPKSGQKSTSKPRPGQNSTPSSLSTTRLPNWYSADFVKIGLSSTTGPRVISHSTYPNPRIIHRSTSQNPRIITRSTSQNPRIITRSTPTFPPLYKESTTISHPYKSKTTAAPKINLIKSTKSPLKKPLSTSPPELVNVIRKLPHQPQISHDLPFQHQPQSSHDLPLPYQPLLSHEVSTLPPLQPALQLSPIQKKPKFYPDSPHQQRVTSPSPVQRPVYQHHSTTQPPLLPPYYYHDGKISPPRLPRFQSAFINPPLEHNQATGNQPSPQQNHPHQSEASHSLPIPYQPLPSHEVSTLPPRHYPAHQQVLSHALPTLPPHRVPYYTTKSPLNNPTFALPQQIPINQNYWLPQHLHQTKPSEQNAQSKQLLPHETKTLPQVESQTNQSIPPQIGGRPALSVYTPHETRIITVSQQEPHVIKSITKINKLVKSSVPPPPPSPPLGPVISSLPFTATPSPQRIIQHSPTFVTTPSPNSGSTTTSYRYSTESSYVSVDFNAESVRQNYPFIRGVQVGSNDPKYEDVLLGHNFHKQPVLKEASVQPPALPSYIHHSTTAPPRLPDYHHHTFKSPPPPSLQPSSAYQFIPDSPIHTASLKLSPLPGEHEHMSHKTAKMIADTDKHELNIEGETAEEASAHILDRFRKKAVHALTLLHSPETTSQRPALPASPSSPSYLGSSFYQKKPSLQFDLEPETHEHGRSTPPPSFSPSPTPKLHKPFQWQQPQVYRPDFANSQFEEILVASPSSNIVVVTPGTLDHTPPRLPPLAGPSALPAPRDNIPRDTSYGGSVRFQESPRLPRNIESGSWSRQVRFPEK